MAKQRFINTKFWSDKWVRQKLNPLDRYLFMYFLTNEHTNISGVYELPVETIAFETGIDKEDLNKSMLPRLKPKVFYVDGWVFITNFAKHQRSRGSPKIEIGIEKAISEIPSHILAKFKSICDRLSIHYPYSSNYSDSDSDSDLDPDIDIDSDITSEETSQAKQIGEIIKAFEEVDPKNKTYYANKTQRAACEFLLKEFGFEEVLKRIKVLPKTNKQPFFPKVNSPNDLKEKWIKLEDAVASKRLEIKSKTNYVL